MMEETQAQTSETVRAIWNRDLTLQLCWFDDILQEATPCMYSPHVKGRRVGDLQYTAGFREQLVMIVVAGGIPLCEICAWEIDQNFSSLCLEAFNDAIAFTGLVGERDPNRDVWMEEIAKFMPAAECHIERGPRTPASALAPGTAIWRRREG